MYILDTHALIYRAHFAMEKLGLKTKAGFPTGALYGMAQYLINIKKTYSPRYWVAVMDPGTKSHRNDLYPEYKANRPPMPDDLRAQLSYIEQLLSVFNITIVKVPGYEGDDIIASIVEEYKKLIAISIVSKDKDLMQLVGPSVRMLAPNGTGVFEVIDTVYVMKKFGVTPSNLGKWLALVGDSSDNIPGVKGIGPKGAVKLINTPNMVGFSDPSYKLSLSLTTLNNYPEVVPSLGNYLEPNKDSIIEFFKAFEFTSLIKDVE
jgi:DNA polymerase-1